MRLKIPLTQGKFAIVGPRDYAYLNQFKWCYSLGYAVRGIRTKKNTKRIWMHRVILKRMGCTNFKETDHINRDGLDNRRYNLRPATHHQNQHNHGKQRNNTSGFKGVCWYKQTKRWRTQIKVDGKRVHLGYFTDKQEAARAYNTAAKKYHGEFACLNIIPPE